MGRGKYILGSLTGVLCIGMYIAGYKTAESWESEIITYDSVQAADAAGTDTMLVKKNTVYTLETYDGENESLTSSSGSVPIELIGLDREEVIDFIENNTSYFSDENYSVLNVMLLSFSDSEVVIRRNVEEAEQEETKSYDFPTDEPKYYVCLEENGVVVYKADKSTIYMVTGITESEIDEASVEELKYGVTVKNISELYRFLESITS